MLFSVLRREWWQSKRKRRTWSLALSNRLPQSAGSSEFKTLGIFLASKRTFLLLQNSHCSPVVCCSKLSQWSLCISKYFSLCLCKNYFLIYPNSLLVLYSILILLLYKYSLLGTWLSFKNCQKIKSFQQTVNFGSDNILIYLCTLITLNIFQWKVLTMSPL